MRWLSQVGSTGSEQPPMGCFDWDPLVYLLGHDIDMVQQDVLAMLDAVFSIIDAGEASQQRIEILPRPDEQQLSRRLAVRQTLPRQQPAGGMLIGHQFIDPAAFKGGQDRRSFMFSTGSGNLRAVALAGYHSW